MFGPIALSAIVYFFFSQVMVGDKKGVEKYIDQGGDLDVSETACFSVFPS